MMEGKTILHYKILEKLGEGGMGVVYKAEDIKLKRKVAIKFLPSRIAANEEERERFKIEAQAAAALNHPNIAHIYAIEEADDEMFIVMEYIEGKELKDIISQIPPVPPLGKGGTASPPPFPKGDRGGFIPIDDVINYATQIAEGLQAAHKKGIVHRDIKSSNIMITNHGKIKIMDFGLAKVRGGAQVTKVGTTIGTAAYMSPEQARGEDADHRSDIWSFGVVFYEMLTGRLPFGGDYEQAVIYSVLNEEPDYADQVPENLKGILQKTLAKKRDERYPNIGEVLSNLNSFSTGTKSVAAKHMRTSGHSPSQRKRWFFYSGLAAILLLAGFAYFVNRSRPIESIAVMPFVNASGNEKIEYLSDGMTETLISSLSQLPKLNVKARSSVFRYKGKEVSAQTIGKELNVQAVLNGRVVQHGEQLTLSLELVNVRTENVIWSEQYNRKQTDFVALQSEIARDVSGKLKTKLSGAVEAKMTRTYTSDPAAYQLYLKGRFQWNKRTAESLEQAAELYRQAIEKDPTYALAYSSLAETYALFSSYGVTSATNSMPQAKAAALRALAIDDSLAEAHTALGFYLSYHQRDWADGEKEYLRAIELKPNYPTAHHWLGNCLANMKRFDESLVELRRAEELDPLSPIIGTNLGDALVYARRYDEAIAQYKRTLSRDPNFAYAHQALGWVYGFKGMYAQAIAETRTSMELDNNNDYGKGYLGLWLAKSGRRDEAIELLKELKQESTRRFVPSYAQALIYIGIGNKEDALKWLKNEMSDGSEVSGYYSVVPELDELRSDPRFKAMLKRINLPE